MSPTSEYSLRSMYVLYLSQTRVNEEELSIHMGIYMREKCYQKYSHYTENSVQFIFSVDSRVINNKQQVDFEFTLLASMRAVIIFNY